MNFDEIYGRFPWKEIHSCPGRYILTGNKQFSIIEILGEETETYLYNSDNTKDPFYLIEFTGGGLISYLKEGGRLIHTLNTSDGLLRKLDDLNIK